MSCTVKTKSEMKNWDIVKKAVVEKLELPEPKEGTVQLYDSSGGHSGLLVKGLEGWSARQPLCIDETGQCVFDEDNMRGRGLRSFHRLKQAYGETFGEQLASKHRMRIRRTVDQDGTVRLKARKITTGV